MQKMQLTLACLSSLFALIMAACGGGGGGGAASVGGAVPTSSSSVSSVSSSTASTASSAASSLASSSSSSFASSYSGTYLSLKSSPEDPVGYGGNYFYTQANSKISVRPFITGVVVNVEGDMYWTGMISLPKKVGNQIVPGVYPVVQGYADDTTAGLEWGGGGRGCTTTSGSLTIERVRYSGEVLVELQASFTRFCGQSASLTGVLKWDAFDSSQAAGPIAVPAGLWSPALAALPSGVNYLYVQSDTKAGIEWVGAGRTYLFTQANAVIKLNESSGLLSLLVRGDTDWIAEFKAMDLLSNLQTGFYGILNRFPVHNPAKGGMAVGGDGRGCNELQGWFAVDKISYASGALNSVDLRFEQYCDDFPGVLRGALHWQANDATAPAGPVAVPGGLWDVAPGSISATGNYVHLASDSGDIVGNGAAVTYSSQNSAISIVEKAGRLNISVGLQDPAKSWRGDFVTMNVLTKLETGFYDNLLRMEFHNPTIGGLTWESDERGCNGSIGWVAIDKVTYSAGVLQALDLRFEQRCSWGVPALHGKIHWTKP